MLTELEIYGQRVATPTLHLSLITAGTDPIQLKKIDGLGPVKGDIATTSYSIIDGEYFTGSSIGKRNIVLTLGLNPNWVDQSIESLRQQLYGYLIPRQLVKMVFHSTHLPDVTISGYVESFEPNIFTKDPEIQVSLICPQPHFLANTPTVFNGTAGGGANTITYPGSIETGFDLSIARNPGAGAVSTLVTLTNGSPFFESFSANVPIGASGSLTFGSVSGNKYFKSETSGGVVTNYLNLIDSLDTWLTLKPGANLISLTSAELVSNPWVLTYTAKYGGI